MIIYSFAVYDMNNNFNALSIYAANVIKRDR